MDSLPYVTGSSTSEAAAVAARPSAATQREKVLDALQNVGPMTDEEIQHLLDMNPSTERPRRIELVADGKVTDSGLKRLTKSNREAVVWRATQGS
jgi:transcription initiation factor IIE alpha subunit